METRNSKPVFRIQFTISARQLKSQHDQEGTELSNSRYQLTRDFFNPAIPEPGQRARLLGTDELEIAECHFDLDRDLWMIDGGSLVCAAVGEQKARQELDDWLGQLRDAGWTATNKAGTTTIVEIPASSTEVDYGDTELAGP